MGLRPQKISKIKIKREKGEKEIMKKILLFLTFTIFAFTISATTVKPVTTTKTGSQSTIVTDEKSSIENIDGKPVTYISYFNTGTNDYGASVNSPTYDFPILGEPSVLVRKVLLDKDKKEVAPNAKIKIGETYFWVFEFDNSNKGTVAQVYEFLGPSQKFIKAYFTSDSTFKDLTIINPVITQTGKKSFEYYGFDPSLKKVYLLVEVTVGVK